MGTDTQLHHRTCPLCEALCGLQIEHRDGEVLSIRGDDEDPFSRGHICPKGNALQDLHADPDRIRRPLRRTAAGWEPVDWDEALDDIADGIVQIQTEHGRSAFGAYLGNPTVHHLGASLTVVPLLRALRSKNRFSATSLDQLPQQLAAFQLFGHGLMFPVADLDRTDFFLCLGGNPLASNGSLMSAGGVRRRLRDLRARGGRFVVVDPRRTESAEFADEHLSIRPGTDVWLLLGMLNVIFREGLARLGAAELYVDGLEELGAAVAEFTPERATGPTGVPADQIRQLARDFAGAERAIAYCRVGLCQQRYGGLASWLVYALGIVTGNLDRPGGMMFTTPAVDPLALAGTTGLGGSFDRYRSRVSGRPEFSGEFPAACMAEEIETPGEGQIRGMLIHAGNPVLSAPNGQRLDRALQQLELLVCIDFYLTETSRHAHYILPPTGPLESAEYDIALSLLAVRNVAKFSPPMVPAPEGSRQDWEILSGLTWRILQRQGRAGQRTATVMRTLIPRLGAEGMLDLALRTGPYGHPAAARQAVERVLGRRAWSLLSRLGQLGPLRALSAVTPPSSPLRPPGVPATGLSLNVLRRHPHGLDLGPLEPRLPERLFTKNKRINLVPELYAEALSEFATDPDAAPAADGLVLIGRRHVRSNNSWMHNSRRLVKGRTRCTLMIHPDDAAARGLDDQAEATVTSRVGEVTLPVELSDTMMPGVVSIPHGFGHDREGIGWQTAKAHAGVSANDLTDDAFLDKLTGNAAFNGVPVAVRAAVAPEPQLAGHAT